MVSRQRIFAHAELFPWAVSAGASPAPSQLCILECAGAFCRALSTRCGRASPQGCCGTAPSSASAAGSSAAAPTHLCSAFQIQAGEPQPPTQETKMFFCTLMTERARHLCFLVYSEFYFLQHLRGTHLWHRGKFSTARNPTAPVSLLLFIAGKLKKQNQAMLSAGHGATEMFPRAQPLSCCGDAEGKEGEARLHPSGDL